MLMQWVMAAVSCVSLFGAALASAQDRPNVLILIADDMTWSDLGYEGNQDVRTPNLDRLRTESMHLRRMFTSAAMCSPARHALYTGLYPVRSGAYPNHTNVYEGTESLFTVLKARGYRVGLQNKQHVGPPSSFPYEHIQRADDLTETKEFITRDIAQPWLFVYASSDPHSPWNRGPRASYDPSVLTIPPYLYNNETTRGLLADYYAEISKFDEQVGRLLGLLEQTGQVDETLVLFVSEQGSSFPYGGKWSLYDNGIRVSTLVRWPGRVEMGSVSDALLQYVDVAPTILEAVGIASESIDVGCPDAFGETGFDGRSFLDVLTGEAETARDYVFAEHTTVGVNGYLEPYPMRAVRDTRYKLIRNLAPENTYTIKGIHRVEPLQSWRDDAESDAELAARVRWLYERPADELYDLETDPYETNNRADDPTLANVRARLRDRLDRWMAQQGDNGLETELRAKSRQPGRRDRSSNRRDR